MDRLVPLGRLMFRFRNWIFPIAIVLALLMSKPRHLFGSPELDQWMDMVGVAIAVLGLIVRAVTIGYRYIVRGGRGKQVYADDLVQTGVYALTRNPMYVGNGLLVLGCAVILNAPAFYLLTVPLTFFAYATIIAAEEAYLRDKFGAEFDAYCARVNRIVPRLSGFSKAVEGMTFDWRRVLVKEYNTFFWAIVQIVALCFVDDFLIEGEPALPALKEALIYLIPWVVLYFIVWGLKKKRILQSRTA